MKRNKTSHQVKKNIENIVEPEKYQHEFFFNIQTPSELLACKRRSSNSIGIDYVCAKQAQVCKQVVRTWRKNQLIIRKFNEIQGAKSHDGDEPHEKNQVFNNKSVNC